MARVTLFLAVLALAAAAPALAWTGAITPLPTIVPRRSLKQTVCSCYIPAFTCPTKATVYCPSGTIVSNPLQAANCSYPGPSVGADPCLGTPLDPQGPPGPVTCPQHVSISKVTYCMDGIPINGGSTVGCSVCQTITLIGNCDINAASNKPPARGQPNWSVGYGRAPITCTTRRGTCTSVGQVLTPTDFGCTATAPPACAVAPTPFWYNSHLADQYYYNAGATNTLPDKIRCTAEMVAGSVTCLYRAGALPCNDCLNKVNNVNIIIGPGAGPISVGLNPVGCATPTFV